jgi:hypothetical protein
MLEATQHTSEDFLRVIADTSPESQRPLSVTLSQLGIELGPRCSDDPPEIIGDPELVAWAWMEVEKIEGAAGVRSVNSTINSDSESVFFLGVLK